MLFPIHSLSSLRSDVYDKLLGIVLDDTGWSRTEAFNIISGLSKGEITCNRACELLDKPARIVPPGEADDIDADSCDKISQELGKFILANMRADKKGSLFPADPFIHQTNSLSLGFGACGVLYTLAQ